MKPTMNLRLVPASDYMLQGRFYESTEAIPHLKLQQLWEPEGTTEIASRDPEWRDVPIEMNP